MNRRDLVRELAKQLRSQRDAIEHLIRSAPYRYKHYQIRKRSGGYRDIYHPATELKIVQRWLVDNLLAQLPVHDSVYSYVRGRNVRAHALMHTQSNYVLRLDFKDFFPSIHYHWISEFLRSSIDQRALGLDHDAVDVVATLLCRRDRESLGLALSIGAPSSPAVSNAILFSLDEAIHSACVELRCTYTRYADDIYVSSRSAQIREAVEPVIRELIAGTAPRLSLNEAKTQRLSRKRRVLITGLNITPDREISVGRRLKRQIKTEMYLLTLGRLDAAGISKLRGMVAYVDSVEPTFTQALVRKFGGEHIQRLLSG